MTHRLISAAAHTVVRLLLPDRRPATPVGLYDWQLADLRDLFETDNPWLQVDYADKACTDDNGDCPTFTLTGRMVRWADGVIEFDDGDPYSWRTVNARDIVAYGPVPAPLLHPADAGFVADHGLAGGGA